MIYQKTFTSTHRMRDSGRVRFFFFSGEAPRCQLSCHQAEVEAEALKPEGDNGTDKAGGFGGSPPLVEPNLCGGIFCINMAVIFSEFLGDYTPPKFNSSPLKSYRNPIGKDRLPTTIFQGVR